MASELRLYFENPVGRVLEHPDSYAVVQYKAGTRKLSDLQAFLTHVGRLLLARGWHRILGDQRAMERFTDEESAWITQHWLTGNINRPDNISGAVLLPRDLYARLSVNQVMLEAKVAALRYHMFEDAAEAEEWLRQQN